MLKFFMCLLTAISVTVAWQPSFAQNRAAAGVGNSPELNRQLDMVENIQQNLEKVADCAQQGHLYNPDSDTCQSAPPPSHSFSADGTELAIQNPDGTMGLPVNIAGDAGDDGEVIIEAN